MTCALNAQINTIVKDTKGKPMLLGKVTKKGLTTSDFEWFSKNYKDYLVNDNVVKVLSEKLKDYKVKVFFGSWCGDSKRELPKFYKVLDEANFNKENLEVIAVDRKPDAYKESPSGEEKGLNIHRVPTFIFYKNTKEVARIVEYPKQDFERDILNIVNGNTYRPNYNIASFLEGLMKEKSLEELNEVIDYYPAYLSEYVKGSRELNTYGYKLLRSGQLKKALFVFKLNTKIFPYKYNVFDSYAEALEQGKEYQKSMQNYAKALSLNAKHTEVLEKITTIKNKIALNK